MAQQERKPAEYDISPDSLGIEGLATAKKRLRHMEEYLPDNPDFFYSYAKYLAERLNFHLDPNGFVNTVRLTLFDLQKGVNGFTNEKIKNDAVGLPDVAYYLLESLTPQVARAVTSEDFAQKVEAIVKKPKATRIG